MTGGSGAPAGCEHGWSRRESKPSEIDRETAVSVADRDEEPIQNATPRDEPQRPKVETPDAPALTLDVLRRKLDAAIVAEAWEAVKAIRQRMLEVERDAAGNVIAIDDARARRGT